MKIALDYDHTYTADPLLWHNFVMAARQHQHDVRIVTFRLEKREGGNQDILDAASILGIPVIFCNGEPKASVWDADIWIDDAPQMIPTPEQLAQVPEIRERVLNNMAKAYETHDQTPTRSSEPVREPRNRARNSLGD